MSLVLQGTSVQV